MWRSRPSQSQLQQRFPFFAEDFDPAAFQSAPRAQQLSHVSGDEPFVLGGLHPKERVIEGQLPGLQARVYAIGPSPDGGVFSEIPMRLDTVLFDLEELTLSLVWRGSHDTSDEHASEVSAWFGHVLAAGVTPSEDLTRHAFWSLYGYDEQMPDEQAHGLDGDGRRSADAAM